MINYIILSQLLIYRKISDVFNFRLCLCQPALSFTLYALRSTLLYLSSLTPHRMRRSFSEGVILTPFAQNLINLPNPNPLKNSFFPGFRPGRIRSRPVSHRGKSLHVIVVQYDIMLLSNFQIVIRN